MTLFPRFIVDTSHASQDYQAMLDAVRGHIAGEADCHAAAADIVKMARLHYALGVRQVEITIVDDGEQPSIDMRPHVAAGYK